jgi:hypothetical protein
MKAAIDAAHVAAVQEESGGATNRTVLETTFVTGGTLFIHNSVAK